MITEEQLVQALQEAFDLGQQYGISYGKVGLFGNYKKRFDDIVSKWAEKAHQG